MKRIIYLIGLGIVYALVLFVFNFTDKQGIIEDALGKSKTVQDSEIEGPLCELPPPPFPPPG
ncbi:hypothetical protein JW835_16020 [bacterium]|nr:hypothetical protein [bacterium]